jgi:Xaa-Pro dipeptidase
MSDLSSAQQFMKSNGIDVWVLYDFRGGNPIFWQLLGGKRTTTRRSFLFLPCEGEGKLLTHVIERQVFESLPIEVTVYSSRADLEQAMAVMLKDVKRAAMEYSPMSELPTVSWVDGGTLEFVRSYGVEVVSSADLCQLALATWSPGARQSHHDACAAVAATKDAAFQYIAEALSEDRYVSEYQAQEFIVRRFDELGLESDHRPIVAVNSNSGNPHYAPTAASARPIEVGDWVLLDLWARVPGEQNIFGDITWVAYAGGQVPERIQQVFRVVARARDLVLEQLEQGWKRGDTPRGWELDQIARAHIAEAGYGKFFVHRLGHSLGPGPTVHGLGVNLDNLETRDTRQLLPGTGFTVEPGIYLPEFGVRLEVNVYIDAELGPQVTTPVQREIVDLI